MQNLIQKPLKILVGFEESGTVTTELRLKGHNAYSCDIKDTRGNKEWHLMMDIHYAIDAENWDIIILHPPCTYMALSGNRHYSKSTERYYTEKWTKGVITHARLKCDKVAVEQPKSTLSKVLGPPTQIIHPWQFGHGEKKETWLWLYNLPKLVPTNIVPGREERIHKMPPGKNRQTERSKTYIGIAKAISQQWTINQWKQLSLIN